MESRPLDRHYDPVYTTRAKGRGTSIPTQVLTSNRCLLFHHRTGAHTIDGLPAHTPIVTRPPIPEVPEAPTNIAQTARVTTHSGPVDVGTQTMYREIETQTDPYSPEYTIVGSVDGEDIPAIFALGLHELTFRHGQLPAGMDEIEAITKIQEKQKFLESLQPATDAKAFQNRRKLLEQQELKEWRYRESLIEREHAERLHIIQNRLEQRNEEIEAEKARRIQEIRHKKEIKLQEQKSKIQQLKANQKRKFGKAKNDILDKIAKGSDVNPKHEIVQLHADFGSKLYAPIKMNGSIPELETCKIEVKDHFPPRIDNLDELQNMIEEIESNFGEVSSKQIIDNMEMLEAGHEDPNQTEESNNILERYGRYQRPATPPKPEAPEELEQVAVSHLQGLLRGRVEQNRIENELEEGNQKVIHEKAQFTSTIGIQADPEREYFDTLLS